MIYLTLFLNLLGYPAFGKILNETGRPMVYSCSWPAYQSGDRTPDYKSIAEHCNLWRNWDDIQDSWASVLSIIDWFADHQDEFQKYAGPGNWNDPDMVQIDFLLIEFGANHIISYFNIHYTITQ